MKFYGVFGLSSGHSLVFGSVRMPIHLRNLEIHCAILRLINTQFPDFENAQHNLEIVQFPYCVEHIHSGYCDLCHYTDTKTLLEQEPVESCQGNLRTTCVIMLTSKTQPGKM